MEQHRVKRFVLSASDVRDGRLRPAVLSGGCELEQAA